MKRWWCHWCGNESWAQYGRWRNRQHGPVCPHDGFNHIPEIEQEAERARREASSLLEQQREIRAGE